MQVTRTGHRYVDAARGSTLDAWFPAASEKPGRACLAQKLGFVKGGLVEVAIRSLQDAPVSTEEAYLRLHLLSQRFVTPNQINLDGIFELLPIVAWTSAGPVLPSRVDALRAAAASEFHHLCVTSVDRFPRMTDYVVPAGVRVADADRVRLGAHLAAGTTVMHEGCVDFNAGTLGPAMVAGRVTPGVTVGKDSDIAAGSSIMGTLSGGGKHQNSLGERSQLGANAVIDIALGDDCIVEAGLYLTAGTKVRTPDGRMVPARALAGKSGLLFRRNGQTGAVEVVPAKGGQWDGLNASLPAAD
jgi:2,3,4,5-tetrahydropyridine-2-carboxylate N-succinyltransferase